MDHKLLSIPPFVGCSYFDVQGVWDHLVSLDLLSKYEGMQLTRIRNEH
ncbi:hypothetical protein [Dyadobacter sp. CY326]|nr:hypothetical protein [Dyadobacter sp. CY326]MCE7067119.1 hypothetical protein [Dyadobacter sp. CY326]